MTFGIAEHRKGEALEACIARADTALYTGKERGRNRVMIGKYRGLTLVS
jgi:PleD family two-component response regulator